MKRIGIGLIRLYRFVFAWLPPSCRFEPTCSRYTEQAIEKYGLSAAAGWAPAGSPGATPGIPGAMTRFADRRSEPSPRDRAPPPPRCWSASSSWSSPPRSSLAACLPGGRGGSGAPGDRRRRRPAAPAHARPAGATRSTCSPGCSRRSSRRCSSPGRVYDVLHDAGVPGAIGIAIIVLTLVVRVVLIPLFRRQLVSQRRMQMLQPELREIQRRYKGDAHEGPARRSSSCSASAASTRSRAACPLLLQLPLLFIDVLGHPERAHQLRPDAMLKVVRHPGRPARLPDAVPELVQRHRQPVHRPDRAVAGGTSTSAARRSCSTIARRFGLEHPGSRSLGAPAAGPVADDAAAGRPRRTTTRTSGSSAR